VAGAVPATAFALALARRSSGASPSTNGGRARPIARIPRHHFTEQASWRSRLEPLATTCCSRGLAPVDQLLLLRNGTVEAFGPRDEVLERLRLLRPPEVPAGPSPVRAQVGARTLSQRELSHAPAR